VRVLYFTRSYSPHDARFLEVLAGSGHEVGFLAYEAGAARGAAPELPVGIQALSWPGVVHEWALAHNVRMLRRVLREFEPALVHAGPVQKAAFLTALAGFHPLVTMSWGSDILLEARSGTGRMQAGYALQRSGMFLCDCRAVEERAVALGMPADRITVFPWGVDLGHFTPAGAAPVREQLGWQDKFVVLSTRSMEALYAVDVTVEAFIRAAGSDPDMRLLLLGDGSQRGMLEEKLQAAGLTDPEQYHFAGRIGLHELPGYYRSADVYASSSTSDGSSISLLEAMACGLPAVVSGIPGNREGVEPGENGWLFPVGEVPAMTAALNQTAADGLWLAEMGSAARAVCEQRANWRSNSMKLLQAYRKALDEVERA